ncbi:MAG: SURF1 family protein [Acetobacteraceae bacterium]
MIRQLRRLAVPGVMTIVMLAVLLGLGTWQVERLHWKQAILSQIARAEAAPAIDLPASPDPFAKVRVSGTLREDLAASYGAEVRDTRAGPQLGSHLIVPLERDASDAILVDRGWVPDSRPAPIARPEGEVMVEGYVRPSDTPGPFSATDSPLTRRFYTLNAAAIGAALGLNRVAPFVLVAMGQPPPETYPDPARHLPRPPNNHLSYAITWYGLAVALVVIFVLWARKVLSE